MKDDDSIFDNLFSEACYLYEIRRYDEALDTINKSLLIKKSNVPARNLKAAILIESWEGDVENRTKIFEAMDHIKICIENDSLNKKIYLMNLGNAYYKLATFDIYAKGILNREIVNNLENAKQCFEDSLSISENQPEVWVNKGNTLSNLGRFFEALYCYDKAISFDSGTYNAWASKGICCLRLLNQLGNEEDKSLLFSHAMACIAIELENNPSCEIDDSYKKRINDTIKEKKTELENLKTRLKKQHEKKEKTIYEGFNSFSSSNSSFKEFYFDFCDRHNLFLNTHFDCENCGISTLDLINTSYLTDINESEKAYEFFKRWYALIDDYYTSRFYLSLSQYNHSDFSFLKKPRYEPDYSLNYFPNVEMLKTAFITAIDIYDKIAFFLKEYEEMHLNDKEIAFWGSNSIFNRAPIIMDKNNWDINLVALYTTASDLLKNELRMLANLRNYLVHRNLILHDIVDVNSLTYPYSNSETGLRNPEYHMDVHVFFQYTINALRQIKSALFALTFFISNKEKQKEKLVTGKIGKLEWAHNWDKNDCKTKAATNLANKLMTCHDKALEDILKELDSMNKNTD